jgi:hypothetical protein
MTKKRINEIRNLWGKNKEIILLAPSTYANIAYTDISELLAAFDAETKRADEAEIKLFGQIYVQELLFQLRFERDQWKKRADALEGIKT